MDEHQQLVRKREMFDSICSSLLSQLEGFEQVESSPKILETPLSTRVLAVP